MKNEMTFYSIEDKNVKWFIIHLIVLVGTSIILGYNITTNDIPLIIFGVLIIIHSLFWILFLTGIIAIGNSRVKIK